MSHFGIHPPRLTEATRRTLEAIGRFRRQRGFSPTLRELATELRRSTVSIHVHIIHLAHLGLLTKDRRSHRSFALTDAGRAELPPVNLKLPILGTICDGRVEPLGGWAVRP